MRAIATAMRLSVSTVSRVTRGATFAAQLAGGSPLPPELALPAPPTPTPTPTVVSLQTRALAVDARTGAANVAPPPLSPADRAKQDIARQRSARGY